MNAAVQAMENMQYARRRWLILATVAIAQLMIILDLTIVNVALPSAQRSLHFVTVDRQWVVTAYALAFGSLLLLGRRSPAKTALVLGLADLPRQPARLGEPLTQSETRVLRYLPTHMGVPEIAAELCLSANTVKTHLRHVYRKLGAHSRHEAVQRARAIGLLAASSRRPWNAGPPYRI
jgi:DNA-binding CsgD family transcriptional regulator